MDNERDESTIEIEVVPLPAVDSAQEHQRVRASNDRDQQAEDEGRVAPHNQGYDEVADLIPASSASPTDD